MKKILYILFINLMLVGVTIGDRTVQADPVCGNGTLEEGEECDDGNRFDGDVCSSDCEIELSISLTMEFPSGQGAYKLSDVLLCTPANISKCIVANITLRNDSTTALGADIIISESALNLDLLYRNIKFIDPDGNEIGSSDLGESRQLQTEPPPPALDPVLVLPPGFTLTSRLPDVGFFFEGFDRTGTFSGISSVQVRAYEDVQLTGTKEIADGVSINIGLSVLESAFLEVERLSDDGFPRHFSIVGDQDNDTFSYPLPSVLTSEMLDPEFLAFHPPDCDDRLLGADGILGTIDDGININPDMTELPGNGLDDDCNPATLDSESMCKFGWPKDLIMVYNGLDCSDMDGEDGIPGTPDDSHSQNGVTCTDFGTLPSGPGAQVWIEVNDRSGHDQSQSKTFFTGLVDLYIQDEAPRTAGETIDALASRAGRTRLKGGTVVHIFDPSVEIDPETGHAIGTDLKLQQVSFHTSCSDPLITGDQFGGVLVFDGTGENE